MAQIVDFNGKKISFPDGMPPAEIEAVLKKNAMQIMGIDPTEGMSGLDKFRAGMGKAMVDTGRGVGQMLGLVSRDDVAESRRLDESLMNTGAGQAGNLAGNFAMIAPTALIPGAATVRGAAAIGAATGLAQPSVSTKETLTNTVLGGAAGAAGQAVANTVPKFARAFSDTARAEAERLTSQNAQKFAAAQTGNKLGYVVPPADLNPGVTSELLSGLSGKIKTAQVASQRNQGVTDKLVRKSLGLTEDATLNTDVLNAVRQQAGLAYEAVSSVGTVQPSKAYFEALDEAVKPFMSQAKSFPGRKLNPVVEDIASLKTGQFDAGDAIETIKIFRGDADAAYRAGDNLAGKAYKKAANALEQAIDDHLVAIKAPEDLLKNYRTARQTIAKTYSVQKALNPQTGSIDALKLASELGRGKPLSGEMRQVAEFAQAFPKAAQALKEAPKAVSPLDMAVAGTGAISTGNPLTLAMLGARPAARSLLLSSPVQKSAMNPGYSQSLLSKALPLTFDNEAFKRLLAPAMLSGGLFAANPSQ